MTCKYCYLLYCLNFYILKCVILKHIEGKGMGIKLYWCYHSRFYFFQSSWGSKLNYGTVTFYQPMAETRLQLRHGSFNLYKSFPTLVKQLVSNPVLKSACNSHKLMDADMGCRVLVSIAWFQLVSCHAATDVETYTVQSLPSQLTERHFSNMKYMSNYWNF